jgi:hypothetical protein
MPKDYADPRRLGLEARSILHTRKRDDQNASRACEISECLAATASLKRCKADDVGFQPRRTTMNTILAAALLTLSLLTAVAAPASAFDAKEFWQQQDRSHY